MTIASDAPPPELLGRYRIVSELGRGAMGIVYKGEDTSLGREVAIKTVLMSFGTEDHEGYLARFRQEAKALGALNHPAIITVYDFGDQGGIAYMAMELLEGHELRELMSAARIAVPLAVELAAQVAEGLAFAHSRGVVHRDVKPGNVMVLEGNRAKIMDFGIARVRKSDVETQAGVMLGSPRYMSPEQVLGRATDSRSDIFSLGVVLYEMLAGAPPFSGEGIPQIMYNVCNTRPLPPSRLNPAVPEVLDLIVAKALEKEPAARYQDAAKMAADLRECMAAVARGEISRAPPALDERTVALAAPMIATPGGGMGLVPSRRFDSTRALERLSRPRDADRELLGPEGPSSSGWQRLVADRDLLAAFGLAALGLAAALAIALS